MGGLVAGSVFVFDVSIQYVHDAPDILAAVRGPSGGRSVAEDICSRGGGGAVRIFCGKNH